MDSVVGSRRKLGGGFLWDFSMSELASQSWREQKRSMRSRDSFFRLDDDNSEISIAIVQ